MSHMMALQNEITQLKRQVDGLSVAQNPRAKAADAAPSKLVTVVAAGAFNVGDCVYLNAGTGNWAPLTTAITGPRVSGVVVSTSGGSLATIALWGPRAAPGTAGTIYYAQPLGGAAGNAPAVIGQWWRVIEVQIDPNTRLVRPDIDGFQPWNVSTCDSGVPTAHVMNVQSDAAGIGP